MSSIDIVESNQIPPGTLKSLSINDKSILVTNVAGKFYAVAGKCTHSGGDLSKGRLEGTTITCPRHGSQFDVTTGKRLKGPAARDLVVYQVRLEGSMLTVDL